MTIIMTKYEKASIVGACAAVFLSGMIIFNALYPHVLKTNKSFTQDAVARLLQSSYETFQIPKKGIIHIGAHYGEELEIYQHNHVNDILWIEADPAAEQYLNATIANSPGSKVAIFAATNTNGTTTLHTTSNDGHSSSIFKLKNHMNMSPDVLASKEVHVPQKRLDDYLQNHQDLKEINYNVIVIDVQGAELVALQGAVQQLQKTDAIIAEVNYDELYSGGVYIADLDQFLLEQGFYRVDSISVNRAYGNALYVKRNFCKFPDRCAADKA